MPDRTPENSGCGLLAVCINEDKSLHYPAVAGALQSLLESVLRHPADEWDRDRAWAFLNAIRKHREKYLLGQHPA